MQHLFLNTHFLGTLMALLALTLKGKLWQIKTNSVRNMTFSVIFKHCDEPTKMSPHFSCAADPTCCTGNVKYFSFRKNQNFWMEYSTPSTTPYPEYKEDSSSTLRPPGPHFLTTNHSRLKSPVGATTILDCQVDNLQNLQVQFMHKFFLYFCLL